MKIISTWEIKVVSTTLRLNSILNNQKSFYSWILSIFFKYLPLRKQKEIMTYVIDPHLLRVRFQIHKRKQIKMFMNYYIHCSLFFVWNYQPRTVFHSISLSLYRPPSCKTNEPPRRPRIRLRHQTWYAAVVINLFINFRKNCCKEFSFKTFPLLT